VRKWESNVVDRHHYIRAHDTHSPSNTESNTIKDPEHINEIGTKFRLDVPLTQYAQSKGLKTIYVWEVETKEGDRSRLLMDGDQVLVDNPDLQAIACRIDIIAFAERRKQNSEDTNSN
jgi:hypothetical protein